LERLSLLGCGWLPSPLLNGSLSGPGAAHAAGDEINAKEINGGASAGAARAAPSAGWAGFQAAVNAARRAEPSAPATMRRLLRVCGRLRSGGRASGLS